MYSIFRKLSFISSTLTSLSIFFCASIFAAPKQIKLPNSLPSKYAGTWERASWMEGLRDIDELIENDESFYFNPKRTYKVRDRVYLMHLTRSLNEYSPGYYDYYFFEEEYNCSNGTSGYAMKAMATYDDDNKMNQGMPNNSSFQDRYYNYKKPPGLQLIEITGKPVWFYELPYWQRDEISLSPVRPGSNGESELIAACSNVK